MFELLTDFGVRNFIRLSNSQTSPLFRNQVLSVFTQYIFSLYAIDYFLQGRGLVFL